VILNFILQFLLSTSGILTFKLTPQIFIKTKNIANILKNPKITLCFYVREPGSSLSNKQETWLLEAAQICIDRFHSRDRWPQWGGETIRNI
jgi:hypothetical protein